MKNSSKEFDYIFYDYFSQESVNIRVLGEYCNDSEGEEFFIKDVMVQGVSIYDIVKSDFLDEIEQSVLDNPEKYFS